VITSRRRWVWIGIFLAVVFAFLAVVTYLPRLSFVVPTAGLTAAERAKAQGDFRGHLLQAFAGLVLIVGAYFTARTFALNREGQITERFTRAVEQLANDEQLDVRLGGIYALERIARDSATHYEPVMEVLTAFLREHSRTRPEDRADPARGQDARDSDLEPRVDFQAVVTILGRRDRRHEKPASRFRLNLRGVDLRGADFHEAHLERADFHEAHLEHAYFHEAHLEGADFREAHLEEAYFVAAYLEEALFHFAYLKKAIFHHAHLRGASFGEAHVEGASFVGADLGRNVFVNADLRGADFGEATGLRHNQLALAFTDDSTTLPNYLGDKAAE